LTTSPHTVSSPSSDNDKLAKAYTTLSAPGSYSGVEMLRRYIDVPITNIRQFLTTQDAYTLHKPIKTRFKRRRIYSKGVLDLLQADIIDLSNISHFNDQYRYILTAIDVFSKRAYAVPLLTKSASEVTDAFEKILTQSGKCRMLNTDRGAEFVNSRFLQMLKKHNIHFYTTNDPVTKAAVIERFQRTFKTKLFKYFTNKNTRRYLDVIDDLLHSYNNTYHRSIKMTPNQVNEENEDLVRSHLYPPKPNKKSKFTFNVGDIVRITKSKNPFAKAYEGGWSEELFTIEKRHSSYPVTYTVQDYNRNSIKGKFYAAELSRVNRDPNQMFKVQEILKTKRTADGKINYYVRWLGYPSEFDSWTHEIKFI